MVIDINSLAGIIILSQWAMFLVGIFVGMVLTIIATLLGIVIGDYITRKRRIKKERKR